MAADRPDRGPFADSAHDRMAEVLKAALESPEEAPIDDATRRLMLHLSIEPPEGLKMPPRVAVAPPQADPASESLLRRFFHMARRKVDGAGPPGPASKPRSD